MSYRWQVVCWGDNTYGQVGSANGVHIGVYTQVSTGGYHTCALKVDGSVACWGFDQWQQAGQHVGPYTQVSAGGIHTCGLTPDGAVECWGNNDYGQAGNHPGPYTLVSACLLYTSRCV